MARKKKIDNALLKRIHQREERERRRYRTTPVRKRILIVCEGEKTEPNYFEAFRRELPRGVVELEIIGTGDNTLNVVNKAIEERNERANTNRAYDQTWAVFDKDSFSDQRFNEAVFLAEREKVGCAYSNEAFELWYLLHFEFYQNAASRTQYSGLLSNHLERPYQKNDIEIFATLRQQGDVHQAVRWAKELSERYDHHSPAQNNPATHVFKLVEELLVYRPS